MKFIHFICGSISCRWALAHVTPIAIPTACQSSHTCSRSQSESLIPRPPTPEPIDVVELPLPAVVSSDRAGSCTIDVNPHRTGCINQTTELQSGSFTTDGKHITAVVTFVGAPSQPDPASIYSGSQIILVKTDGSLFPNGDAWKCLTCGIPVDNANPWDSSLAYPQAFKDGKRLLAGTNILSCGQFHLVSEECTPVHIHIHPIHWAVSPYPNAPSGSMRELRLHPDDNHIAWSSFTSASAAGQLCYLGRLSFNPSPVVGGLLPPRYDLTNVNLLYSPANAQPLSFSLNGSLTVNRAAITVGEVRGFSGTGHEIIYIGYPHESCNIDVFAADLHTGAVRRLTSHPEYADPVDISPDDNWTVVMDTRGSGRQMFLAGMRHVPPVIDMLVTAIVASTRNNGRRRFFQPWLIDRYGDRGTYFGQRINAGGCGSRSDNDHDGAGSIDDPNWNGLADPKFSPDGTQIVYHQALVVPPACGGHNPLPCPRSTVGGGRTRRVMLARLTSRAPLPKPDVVPAPDVVPWGTRYVPGQGHNGVRPRIPAGSYTLYGGVSGHANITVVSAGNDNDDDHKGAHSGDDNQGEGVSGGMGTNSVAVTYMNFCDSDLGLQGDHDQTRNIVLNGHENVTVRLLGPMLYHVDWFSDLVQTSVLVGAETGSDAAGAGASVRADKPSQQAPFMAGADFRSNDEDDHTDKAEGEHGMVVSTKRTGPGGFHLSIDVMRNVFEANGTLTTVVDGVEWRQPENGT